jgi:sulfite reductase beta subunit-like hemoprotein
MHCCTRQVVVSVGVLICALVSQVPSGELTSEQLRRLANCVRPYGEKGCGDITTRANIQLRGITMEDASSVYNEVQDMGLTSVMTGMDNVRNLTGSPIAGLDPHELIDVRPMLEELQVHTRAACLPFASPCMALLVELRMLPSSAYQGRKG